MNPFTQAPRPDPRAVLRRRFGLVSPSHHRAVLLPGGGGPWPGAAVRRRAAAGRDQSVLEGQGQRQGCVGRRRQGVPVPFCCSQHGRRREGERQRESSHVEKPAHTSRHLRRGGWGEERSVFAVRDELGHARQPREERGCSVRGWLLVGTQLRSDLVHTRQSQAHTWFPHTHTRARAQASLVCVPVSGS